VVEDGHLGHRPGDDTLAPVSGNGRRRPARPRIEVAGASASPAETAAIAAAIEQFLRDTAPPPEPASAAISPWLRAGLFEGAGLDASSPLPWGDPEPWGTAGRGAF